VDRFQKYQIEEKRHIYPNVSLTASEELELKTSYGEEDFDGICYLLELYKQGVGREFSSDYSEIIYWVAEAYKNGETEPERPEWLEKADAYEEPDEDDIENEDIAYD
jgi:hypothetical protein